MFSADAVKKERSPNSRCYRKKRSRTIDEYIAVQFYSARSKESTRLSSTRRASCLLIFKSFYFNPSLSRPPSKTPRRYIIHNILLTLYGSVAPYGSATFVNTLRRTSCGKENARRTWPTSYSKSLRMSVRMSAITSGGHRSGEILIVI